MTQRLLRHPQRQDQRAHRAVGWTVTRATTLVDDASQWFQAVAPSTAPARAWVAERQGDVFELSLVDGRRLRTLHVDDVIYQAGMDARAGKAVVLGKGSWILDLGSGQSEAFDLGRCIAGRPQIDPARMVALVPCTDGPVLIIDLKTGAVAGRLDPPSGSSAVGVDPGGSVYVGSGEGALYGSTDLKTLRRLTFVRCRAPFESIAVAKGGIGVLPSRDGNRRPRVLGTRSGKRILDALRRLR